MLKFLLITLFLTVSSLAEIKVQTRTLGEKSAEKIEYRAGNLLIYPKLSDKFHEKVSLTNIIYVDCRETKTVKFLRNAFDKGLHTAIATEKGLKILEENYHTGWGKKATFYLAISCIKSNKFQLAEKVLKQGRIQIPGKDDKEDLKLLQLAELHLKAARDISKIKMASLEAVEIPGTALGKMYYYGLHGKILENKDEKSLAVISYYKSVFLGVKNTEREELISRIEAIYKKQNDPRTLTGLKKL